MVATTTCAKGQIIEFISELFRHWLQTLPLEVFVLIGTFIEEIFSPIPSFLVLVPAGIAVKTRELPIVYMLLLMVFSAVGRIAGAAITYWIGSKLEGVLLNKERRFLKLSHQQVDQVRRRIQRGGRRGYAALFTLNAVPIFPTAALSLICGFIKLDFKMFAFCCFFGTMINALIFMTIGYAGFHVLEVVKSIHVAGQVVSVLLAITLLVWFVRYRKSTRKGKVY